MLLARKASECVRHLEREDTKRILVIFKNVAVGTLNGIYTAIACRLYGGGYSFKTQDGKAHKIDGEWDLLIAHPPCTYLAVSGNRWFSVEKYGDKAIERAKNKEEAIKFFMRFVNADCKRVAIENPIGAMSRLYRKPDQIYNPYDFEGETECKKTCLWLKGLNPLSPTQILPKEKRTTNIWKSFFNGHYVSYGSEECAKERSKTPLGVARAMAEQWGGDMQVITQMSIFDLDSCISQIAKKCFTTANDYAIIKEP